MIFQADPFAELARLNEAKQDKNASDLVLVCEDSSKQVGASYFNRVWIRQCIGQEFYHRVALPDGTPFCSAISRVQALLRS